MHILEVYTVRPDYNRPRDGLGMSTQTAPEGNDTN